jgi:menaquinone-dependent protoporphyrinogen IX oxidase
MKIEYVHASHYGNGAMVAEEFKRQMAATGVTVNIHHLKEMSPKELPPADLYVFSSPGRLGRPISGAKRFVEHLRLPAGTKYAILTTEATPHLDNKTGTMPTETELAKYQRVRPIMNEILDGQGLVRIAEEKVHVTGLKGPLEQDWEKKIQAFVAKILMGPFSAVRPSDSKMKLEESK